MAINKKQNKKILLPFLLLLLPCMAICHDMRPASLIIKQISNAAYSVTWKVPRNQDKVLSIRPVFPGWFNYKDIDQVFESGSGIVLKNTVYTEHDIHGMLIKIQGIEKSNSDVLVQVELLSGAYYSFLLNPNTPIGNIPMVQTKFSTFTQYLKLGIKHILLGFDHLFFVIALYMLSRGKKQLLFTVTSFTIAHSITLSLAALGHIRLQTPPVEATIALSILFLVRELLIAPTSANTFTSNYPWIMAFLFGLLHGLGFAGALAETGLPQLHLPMALLSFNIGVEFGQLLFLCGLMLISFLNHRVIQAPKKINRIIAYSIGIVAGFWFIDRIFIFFH